MNNVIDEYIHNQLPLYLLHLRDMKLLRRNAVKEVLQTDVDIFIRSNLPTESGASLDDLSNRTKVWISKRTAYAIFSHRWLSTGELAFDDVRRFEKFNLEGFQRLETEGNREMVRTGKEILDVLESCVQNGFEGEVEDFGLLKALKGFCGSISNKQRNSCPDLVKLVEFCDASRLQGCNLVWFDTGCIDKSRSAELEESIRSMFNWYRRSSICIVHLADTTGLSSLKRDPWFSRGWTLQELLAPERIIFFGASWLRITPQRSLSDENDKVGDDILGVPLWETISTITGISVDHLLTFSPGITHARDALVWASKRRTTRIEDIAYCLIGLLNIPLSIAYGEGNMAFYRLQTEILERSPDIGLFAWVGQPSPDNSMLAGGVHCFSTLPFKYNIDKSQEDSSGDQAHMLTNRGLRISFPVYAAESTYISGQLQVEELGKVTVGSLNQVKYDSLKIAILSGANNGSATLAVVLARKEGRWTRIPTERHIILDLPPKLKETVTLHIK